MKVDVISSDYGEKGPRWVHNVEIAMPSQSFHKTIFKSRYGAVRVYTRRHIHGCRLISADEQNCNCPKWIYSKAQDGKPLRQTAGTPNFIEACEVAKRILRNMDPEIREAREWLNSVQAIRADIAEVSAKVDKIMAVLKSRD